jgi:hypothetical protein
MEEAFGLSVYCEYGGSFRLNELLGEDGDSWVSNLAPLYRVFLLDDDVANYRQSITQAQELAEQPYHQVAREWKGLEEGMEDELRGLIARMIIPALWLAAGRFAEADARHQLARLGLAAQQYERRHGRFPDSLEALTPDFVLTVARDPFVGRPMKAAPTERGFTVYSIGPDGIDDGGRAFDDEKRTGDLTFELYPGSGRPRNK